MATRKHDPNLVVIQLSGGNDYLNTIVPFNSGDYYDFRPTVNIDGDAVLPIDDNYGFNPNMAPIKDLYDQGKVAVINGIGYPNPNRSHFRSMDIWHTAEPDDIATEGWLGRATRDLDPTGENVLTAVNFGRGLPRALGVRGVPVASVGNLETYGLFPDLKDEMLRKYALDAFAKMYGGERGRDAVMDFLGQTGTDALKGADLLRTSLDKYSSNVEYAANPIAQSLNDAAKVMFADLGTRIFYTQQEATTLTPVSSPLTRRSSATSPRPSRTSTTTSRSMTARTTPSSSSSPSSEGASRTTAPAPTTAQGASPSSSEGRSTAECTASTLDQGGGPARG